MSPRGRGPTGRHGALLLALGVLLSATACARFDGLKPLEPAVGRPAHYPKVDSLQPVLAWEASREPGATYDLAICPAQDASFRVGNTGTPGQAVYYRQGLRETRHRVETPLEPRTKYLWSVRVRAGGTVSDWSTYTYMYGGRVREQYLDKKLPFRFRTPEP